MSLPPANSVRTLLVLFLFFSVLSVSTHQTQRYHDMVNREDMLPTTNAVTSGLDLDRVDYKSNHFVNPGFESWDTEYRPDDVSTSISYEKYGWIASTPWPVAEGSNSVGMQVRSLNGNWVQSNLDEGGYLYWSNPINLTMSFSYYIDNIPNPINQDSFQLEFRLDSGGTRRLRYYFGSTPSASNSTFYRYFLIDAPFDQWHQFDRNITDDFIDAFSVTPTEYEGFDFWLRSYSSDYARVFLDNISIYNTTLYKSDDYEGFGDIRGHVFSSNDPGLVSRSTTEMEGDYSLNLSVYSLANDSYASLNYNPYLRFTEDNTDTFSFYWQIDEFTKYSEDTLAYVYVTCQNATDEFYIYYPLAYGDTFKYNNSGYHYIFPNGFNNTGTWNLFERSIWDDIKSRNQTDEVIVTDIEFEVQSSEYDGNITLLIDDMNLHSATLNVMGHEDQGTAGDFVSGWYSSSSYRKYLNVTGFALNGSKAANLTVYDSNDYYGSQDLPDIVLDDTTELYFTFAYYIDDFENLTNDYVEISLYLYDESELTYVIANESNRGGNGEAFDLPSEKNQWYIVDREIAVDYTTAFHTQPNDLITEVAISASGDGRIEVILDDFYLYQDVAPSITNIQVSPATPEYTDLATVSADVVDKHLDEVTLHYKIESGNWVNVSMMNGGSNSYSADIPAQAFDTQVTYFISANDTYGKLTESSPVVYTVGDTVLPEISVTSPSNESTVSGVVEVNASANDIGSDIDKVEYIIDSVSVFNDSSAPYSYEWNTTGATDGDHDIIVRAYDTAGNMNETLLVVTVDNEITTTTTTSTTTTLPPGPLDPTLILLIVGVIAVVAIVVVYMVVIRPRQGGT